MAQIEFGARIPEELYKEFKALFPIYGATTWFIITSLRKFLEQVNANPTLKDQVSQSIEQMLQQNREDGSSEDAI